VEEMNKHLQFSYTHALVDDTDLGQYTSIIENEIAHMKQAFDQTYSDKRCSINLAFDEAMIKQISDLVERKKHLNPEYLIVVGIGGSNLGAIAVQQAVLGRIYNEKNPFLKILYADTVDADQIHDIITLIQPILKNGKHILLCGISKSGGTTETIANFEILVDLLESYEENAGDYVVTITDDQSKLWHLAQKKDYSILTIPKKVGGRFSVFSPVGLFPLAMLGIDIKELRTGAQDMVTRCLNGDIKNNPAAMSALLIYHHYMQKRNIHDLFLFSTDLESIGKWYRQLMAESIGKEYDQQGNKVYTGITPTVSIGSVDLHSMAQLYLGGPFDKFTTFVSVHQNNNQVNIPNKPDFDQLVQGIQQRPISEIMSAIYQGTKKAFEKGKRPFIEIILSDKSERSIGQFLQMKMMEIMYLGALMNVNPFDQPNVESYKVETRSVLESNTREVMNS
jgi:glucose-6-phosphate isomerase